jgi:L-histidine Nalpha-methyltransferase
MWSKFRIPARLRGIHLYPIFAGEPNWIQCERSIIPEEANGSIPVRFSFIVPQAMTQENTPTIFAAEKRAHWRALEPEIWSIQGADLDAVPTQSILTTLWDQPRWLEAYHLYDQRGSELFEQICGLPEYYLTRTENAILETHARDIIARAPVRCIVELGAGYSKKTVHLLTEQLRQRGSSIFAPIDVSAAGLRASRAAVRSAFPEIQFHGLHARYEEGFSAIDKNLPTLFVFLGSTIGNFNHSDFPRFFRTLSAAMGPGDFLLLGADRVKDVKVLEDAYNDSRGVTAEFILNVFDHINRLLHGNFARDNMRYYSRYNPEWQRIEMYAVARARQDIRFADIDAAFQWQKDEKILVEISRKFDPLRLQEQLRFFDLGAVEHFTDPREWFSVLLFKKES